MTEKRQMGWAIFWSIFLTAFISIQVSRGVTVTLEAYVSYGITSSNGSDLADGSVIYVMGSQDAINDGMMQWQGAEGPTGYVGHSTLGDDIYIGMVRVDSAMGVGGTFYAGPFYFDSDLVNYLYIRIFDTNGIPLGYVNWTVSDVYAGTNYDPVTPVVYVDFNPTDSHLSTTNYNYFYIVPEPGTAQLLMLTAGLMYGFRMCFLKRRGSGN